MSFSVVIPARFGSSRLPGKPLLDIAGKPMIQHVWERARQSDAQHVYIATDDERIMSAAEGFGARALMTSPDHVSGTDRLHEVVEQLGLDSQSVVVNVQGDEPLIPAAVINQVAANLISAQDAMIATLAEPISSAAEFANPNAVKVVTGHDSLALYFSRAPIPWPRESAARGNVTPEQRLAMRHIGIYAYRAAFLRQFVQWPPAALEEAEQLEQLRALYHGVAIHVAEACADVPAGVDTPEDLESVREILRDA
ncbi:MAG: 3-deoxy-manno-octulosonate cytidylyltransferase [Halioglobus sp.]